MGFKKIEEADLIGKLVSDLQDTPEMTAGELKEHFDRLSKEAIIPRFNELVDDLHAETAAGNIGMTVPEEIKAEANVGAVVGKVAEIAKANAEVKHSHENKTVLDLITGLVKEGYDRLVLLFQNIKSVSDTVSDDSTQLPTGKAIVAYVKKLGAGDMQASIYDTNENGIVDDSEKLGGETPDKYQKVTDQTLQTESKTIPGAINELFSRKQASTATDLEYDNSISGLQATNGQGAIDELAASFSTATDTIGDVLVAKGVTVPDGTSLLEMAPLIENNLAFVLKEQQLTSNHSFSGETDVGTGRWNIPFSSITENNIISVSNGTFTCKTDIKQLNIGGTVYMGCGSMGACYMHLVSNGTTKASGSGGSAWSEKSMNYSWENVPAGTTFYFQTSSSGSNAATKYRYGRVTLGVII